MKTVIASGIIMGLSLSHLRHGYYILRDSGIICFQEPSLPILMAEIASLVAAFSFGLYLFIDKIKGRNRW